MRFITTTILLLISALVFSQNNKADSLKLEIYKYTKIDTHRVDLIVDYTGLTINDSLETSLPLLNEAIEIAKLYVGKIAFAKGTNVLRNQKYNEPIEKKSNFITKAELGNTVAWKPYFELPLEVSHPGAWFNITYEMAGITTDREALRKSSTVFSKNIPQMEDDKDKFYFYHPRVLVDASNNVADYAFLELLRKTQDQLKEGKTYDLKVTVWAFKDGANIAPVATGNIELEYVAGEKGSKPNLYDPTDGWITIIEKLLD